MGEIRMIDMPIKTKDELQRYLNRQVRNRLAHLNEAVLLNVAIAACYRVQSFDFLKDS